MLCMFVPWLTAGPVLVLCVPWCAGTVPGAMGNSWHDTLAHLCQERFSSCGEGAQLMKVKVPVRTYVRFVFPGFPGFCGKLSPLSQLSKAWSFFLSYRSWVVWFFLFFFFFLPTRFFLCSLEYFKLYGFADCKSKIAWLCATIMNLLQVTYVLVMTFFFSF